MRFLRLITSAFQICLKPKANSPGDDNHVTGQWQRAVTETAGQTTLFLKQEKPFGKWISLKIIDSIETEVFVGFIIAGKTTKETTDRVLEELKFNIH